MKKIILFLFAAVVFAACDPGYTCDQIVHNCSDHSVIIKPLDYTVRLRYYNDTIKDTIYYSEQYEIAPGKSITIASIGHIGYASREECIYYMRDYLGDSVKFIFDDNKSIVFHSDDTTGWSPYNFDTTCYHYEQDLTVRRGKPGLPYYGKLTLLIDNAFHSLAQ